MHVLFVHRAFPAQFGRIALELTKRYGWKCSVAVEHLSRCPTPSPEMLQVLDMHFLPRLPPTDISAAGAQRLTDAMQRAVVLARYFEGRKDLRPDLVVGHGGLLPTLFLRDIFDCPFVDYCEYYFAPSHCDLTYRQDLACNEQVFLDARCINAATLLNLTAVEAGYAPTCWQRDSFPARFADRIEVHFDGIDTELYSPGPPRADAIPGLPAAVPVVTYVARGLESMRGFDLFLEVARRIAATRDDVWFIVCGDDNSYYGWDARVTGTASFKEWAVQRTGCDLGRFVFLGHIEPEVLVEVLRRSDLHLYLSVPFVTSWSLFNALACGRVVLAGDIAPVREVIEPGVTGLLEPLFDVEALAATALRVLAAPAEHAPLGRAARELLQERYGLEQVLPGIMSFFARVAADGRARA
jgi:glycosyltransferase involved in cell wall biosynthesis